MKDLLLNLLAAALWVSATDRATAGNWLLGFLVGHAGLYLIAQLMPGTGVQTYLRRSRALVRLVGFFLWELLLSNLRVARDVLRVRPSHRPAILAVPMKARTDLEITLLAILVILTPGTLALDVDEAEGVLFVHVLDAPDPEAFRREIRDGFEARILEVTR